MTEALINPYSIEETADAIRSWVAGTVKALHRYDGSSAAGNSVMMYGSGIQG
jgi:hypothetical protein